MYGDVCRFNMNYDAFKQLCRKTWGNGDYYLCFDGSTKRYQVRYWIRDKSKETFIECIPETNPFLLL